MLDDLNSILDEIMPIRVYDQALDPLTMDELRSLIQEQGFKFGWHSNGDVEFGHWNTFFAGKSKKNRIPVDDLLTGVVQKAVAEIKERYLPPEAKVLRCYSNAYAFGTEGYPHTDSKIDSDMTVVLYMNEEWKPEWAGETVFFDEEDEIIQAVLPKHNRCVIFPSAMLHVGRSVSRICSQLRTVFVLKVATE